MVSVVEEVVICCVILLLLLVLKVLLKRFLFFFMFFVMIDGLLDEILLDNLKVVFFISKNGESGVMNGNVKYGDLYGVVKFNKNFVLGRDMYGSFFKIIELDYDDEVIGEKDVYMVSVFVCY